MKFISLASSSKGNSALISYKNTNILIDCGLSKKIMESLLNEYGLSLINIDRIFVTHEHTDHILGIPYILNEHNIVVSSQHATLRKVLNYCEQKCSATSKFNFKELTPLNSYDENGYEEVGDIKVYPIKGIHDVPSMFYKFEASGTKFAIITDIGMYTDYIVDALKDCDYIMLECNYDLDMLMNNSYPYFLKNRIRGKGGHLSNIECAEVIMKIAGKPKAVYLSHISDESNSEEYALKFVKKYLKDHYTGNEKLPKIYIANRLTPTTIIDNED